MRVLILGVAALSAGLTACTSGACYGTARYSADSAPAPLASGRPVVTRRSAPVWPSEPAPVVASPRAVSSPRVTATAPLSPPARTASSAPVVLSSRTPTTVAPPAVVRPLPPPAYRARSAAELAAALRPINATCPVMIGSPVDPNVTASWQGRVVAFADTKSRSSWLADPDRFTANLPGVASAYGSGSDSTPFAAAPSYAPSATFQPVAAPSYTPPAPSYAPPAAVAPPYAPAPAASPPAAYAPPRPSAAPAPMPPPLPAAAPAADAGGACEGDDCPGGNCKLPPRRK